VDGDEHVKAGTQVLSLTFPDTSANDTAWIGVRVFDQPIGLTLSLMSDGDVEVFLSPDNCQRVIEGLERAHTMSDPLRPAGPEDLAGRDQEFRA
jgi:hypothetical protein